MGRAAPGALIQYAERLGQPAGAWLLDPAPGAASPIVAIAFEACDHAFTKARMTQRLADVVAAVAPGPGLAAMGVVDAGLQREPGLLACFGEVVAGGVLVSPPPTTAALPASR